MKEISSVAPSLINNEKQLLKRKKVLKEKKMLIRKVPFIHAFKFFTFQKMPRTPGNARRIKVPLSEQARGKGGAGGGGKKSINFFEIKSADSAGMSQVVFRYERWR